MKNQRHILNNRIRASQVRVITGDGENLGVLKTSEALKEAHKRNLDLVLVSPLANPPVAKILDFSKFLYDERKKKSSTKSKKSEVKEIQFGPLTGTGDMERYIRRAKEFIEDGNKVKINVRMRGRQAMFPEVAFEKIDMFKKGIEEVAKIEGQPKRNGSIIRATFTSK